MLFQCAKKYDYLYEESVQRGEKRRGDRDAGLA